MIGVQHHETLCHCLKIQPVLFVFIYNFLEIKREIIKSHSGTVALTIIISKNSLSTETGIIYFFRKFEEKKKGQE